MLITGVVLLVAWIGLNVWAACETVDRIGAEEAPRGGAR